MQTHRALALGLTLLTTGLGAQTPTPAPWPALQPSVGEAFRRPDGVLFRVPATGGAALRFKRLNNILRRVVLVAADGNRPLGFGQTPSHWTVRLPQRRTTTVEVLVEVEGQPRLAEQPFVVAQSAGGTVTLPAHHAVVHGEKMCFEPMPHKNTLGYWVNPRDWAEWHLRVDRPGRFDVVVWQGCGRGQGGSEVAVSVADQELRFRVEETGHFQCFRRRHIGTVEIAAAGPQVLQVRPRSKARGAVMDLRRVELIPARPRPAATAPRRPNVIIFLTDDQGTLDAGCYGSRDLFTPNIDGLAASGVRFTQAYAHLVCCPSRALLLTGRHPQRGGVNRWTQGDLKAPTGVNMKLAEVTLAEVLRGAGYRTGLFGKWHLGAARTHGPTRQGFDEFFGHRGGFIDNYNHHFLHGRGFHDLYRGTEEVFARDRYFPDLVVEEARGFLDRNRARPFFLFVALNIPHYPEQGDARFDMFYARHPMPRQSYGRMISTADDRIGQIMARVEELGLRERTLVVFLSDNGHSTERASIRVDDHSSGLPKGHAYGANGGGGNTGKWRGHKNTFFEGGLRVPAILSFPGQLPAGAVRDQAVTFADIFPTVVELCGLPAVQHRLDGLSLRPILLDPAAPSHHRVLHWNWFERWAVREGPWKLIHDPRLGRDQVPFLANLEEADPERTNHARTRPELVRRLTALHGDFARDAGAPNK